MERLNLPEYNFKIKVIDGKHKIFDRIRKKYVVLTPEEWVRQHFSEFLIQKLGFPKSLFRIESGLKYNTLQKRSDLVIYNNHGSAIMIIECKSYQEKIGQKTFDQLAVYNKVVKANYLVITNGLKHYCCKKGVSNQYEFLDSIPEFRNL